jgi:hypothetical protein
LGAVIRKKKQNDEKKVSFLFEGKQIHQHCDEDRRIFVVDIQDRQKVVEEE